MPGFPNARPKRLNRFFVTNDHGVIAGQGFEPHVLESRRVHPAHAKTRLADLAGWLFGMLGMTFGGWLGYLIAGFIGACILILIVRAVRGSTA